MVGITTLEAVKHIKKYRRHTGEDNDEIIRKLVETIVEEGIGATILGTFEIEGPAAPRVKNLTRYVGMGKKGELPETLSVGDIQKALGKHIKNRGDNGDGKVKNEWQFTVDGDECGIWDYHGARWSAYGPAQAFAKLGLAFTPNNY
jgi:hypothetical protein